MMMGKGRGVRGGHDGSLDVMYGFGIKLGMGILTQDLNEIHDHTTTRIQYIPAISYFPVYSGEFAGKIPLIHPSISVQN